MARITLRILLLNQFYPPDDAPTGVMLRALCMTLADRGHDVRVVPSRLSYDGSRDLGPGGVEDGVQVVRTGGTHFHRRSSTARIAAYATYLIGAVRAGFSGPAPDVVVSLTTPPFLGLAGALVAWRRRSRHTHWTMDVYPDALRAHWPSMGNRAVWSGLAFLGRLQFRGASMVVAPGPRVARRLRAYVPASMALPSIPLWSTVPIGDVDASDVARLREARSWRPTDIVMMYSGNMGLGHRFGEFLDVARQTAVAHSVWAFAGDGPRRGELERFRANNPSIRVELLPYVGSSQLAASLAAADVQLVSMAPGWEGVMVPSKLQNAFAVGRPAIFVGPESTEIAEWIKESGGGWVVAPDDTKRLIHAIEEARDPAERNRRGRAALTYARVHFDRDKNCEELASLIERSVRVSA